AVAVLVTACGSTQQPGSNAGEPLADPRSEVPLPAANPLRNASFGDLHLHTSMSFDAYTMKTNTLPEDSYRFAQGEAVDYLGQQVQRR
ncbi:DUF3604 domain-containing protein, partial [Acinetobacter baumannii]